MASYSSELRQKLYAPLTFKYSLTTNRSPQNVAGSGMRVTSSDYHIRQTSCYPGHDIWIPAGSGRKDVDPRSAGAQH